MDEEEGRCSDKMLTAIATSDLTSLKDLLLPVVPAWSICRRYNGFSNTLLDDNDNDDDDDDDDDDSLSLTKAKLAMSLCIS